MSELFEGLARLAQFTHVLRDGRHVIDASNDDGHRRSLTTPCFVGDECSQVWRRFYAALSGILTRLPREDVVLPEPYQDMISA